MAVNKVIYNGSALIDISDSTIEASNVLSGYVGYNKAGNRFTGTASSGGDTKNVQCYQATSSTTATTMSATQAKLTVAKTGTYRISWMGWRNTNSGTSGSQLYIAGKAYGSANTTFTNTYGQYVNLTNVALTAGQEICVYARARSSSYIMVVGNLCIVEN